jgi:glyoxylase-like metal-dependent hydrolase (beta-lactamase superfamily II)
MMKETVGRLADQSAVRQLRLDDVILTYVVDGAMAVSPDWFFPAIPAQYWADQPDTLNSQRQLAMSTGGLLVQRANHTLMIDAGMGELSVKSAPHMVDCGEFVNVLKALGVSPDDVDTLVFTHLHLDHVGWAFVPAADGSRTKTFPNANYIVSDLEWQPFVRGERPVGAPPHDTFVEPLTGVRHLIDDGDGVAPGVMAIVTPGHSAGHTSYVVTSATGRRLVAFGDVFHTPTQLAHPDWASAPDTDAVGALEARARIVDELTRPNTFGFGVHFGDQPFGQVTRRSDGKPYWAPTPSTEIMPAPRSGQ